MHELSIALGIVQLAEDEVNKANARQVDTIELEIGAFSGIELDSFDYVWPVAVKNTVLEHSRKEISYIHGLGYCMDCQKEFSMEHLFDPCPSCGNYLKNIIKGRELRVVALEVS
jgi:hydrogenase nickel incorporation protein HypA/HybF